MAKNITETSLGNLFDIFFLPLILFVLPLFLFKWSLKKINGGVLPNWVMAAFSIGAIFFSFVANFGQTYNYFVQLNENIERKYHRVELLYDKSFELISKMTFSIDSYKEYEKEIITSISQEQVAVSQSRQTDDKVAAVNSLDNNLHKLMLNLSYYPNLKTDQLVLELIAVIKDSETEISESKQAYNEEVETFNKNYKAFPYTLVARMAGYEEKEYFSQSN